MKNLKLLAATSVTGVVIAAGVVAPAYAWHPEVKITKYVTNVTANGEKADANTVADAVSVKPGDTIKYTFVIENPAKPAANNDNDLYFTKLTDQLPAGVELASDASKRQISDDLGVLVPGQKVTKEYTFKVTSTKDEDVITNEACVTGNSKVNDAPRKHCDTAVIKVDVPPTPPEQPKETPKETPTETPKVLPATGPAGAVAGAGALSIFGYAANLLRLKYRKNR